MCLITAWSSTIECSSSAPSSRTSRADRAVRADERVLEHGTRADHGRAADRAALDHGGGMDLDPALDARLRQVAAGEVGLDRVEDHPVRGEQPVDLARVLPRAVDDPGLEPAGVADRAHDLRHTRFVRAARAPRRSRAGPEHEHARERLLGRRDGLVLDEPQRAHAAPPAAARRTRRRCARGRSRRRRCARARRRAAAAAVRRARRRGGPSRGGRRGSASAARSACTRPWGSPASRQPIRIRRRCWRRADCARPSAVPGETITATSSTPDACIAASP